MEKCKAVFIRNIVYSIYVCCILVDCVYSYHLYTRSISIPGWVCVCVCDVRSLLTTEWILKQHRRWWKLRSDSPAPPTSSPLQAHIPDTPNHLSLSTHSWLTCLQNNSGLEWNRHTNAHLLTRILKLIRSLPLGCLYCFNDFFSLLRLACLWNKQYTGKKDYVLIQTHIHCADTSTHARRYEYVQRTYGGVRPNKMLIAHCLFLVIVIESFHFVNEN